MNDLAGGQRLMEALNRYNRNLTSAGSAPHVNVGFLEGSTYDDKGHTPVAQVALTNEFGGVIHREAGTTTVYRKTDAKGTHFLKNGRFVKKSQSNFASEHSHDAYTITIPPRPFFRTMVREKSPAWPEQLAGYVKVYDFDVVKSLSAMGELIRGQLVASIKALVSPPNAVSTIAKKGFDKPLIDSGHMWQSVDKEVIAS